MLFASMWRMDGMSMALFPQGLTNVDQRCNAGERRVFNQLERCLEDDSTYFPQLIGPTQAKT